MVRLQLMVAVLWLFVKSACSFCYVVVVLVGIEVEYVVYYSDATHGEEVKYGTGEVKGASAMEIDSDIGDYVEHVYTVSMKTITKLLKQLTLF